MQSFEPQEPFDAWPPPSALQDKWHKGYEAFAAAAANLGHQAVYTDPENEASVAYEAEHSYDHFAAEAGPRPWSYSP